MNTDTVMNNTTSTSITPSSVSVKITRGDEKRRFNFKGKFFQELKALIAEIFSIPVDQFTLQYQDDEKDRVTLSSDAELSEAIKLHKYVLRFYVISKENSNNAPHVAATPIPPAVPAEEGEVAPVPPPFAPHPHHHYGRGRRGPHGGDHQLGPFGGFGGPFGGHGPHGHGPFGGHHGGPYGHGRPGHHGHKHKRCMDKEDREMMKQEKKRFKKQRRNESSSSSSSEDDAQKIQRKEMKQLVKATKQQIKMNWAATKSANPAQWPENHKLMVAEIKAAKRLIHEQYKNPNTPVPAAEQNVSPAPVEMQA
eukprot:TRINITY_DN125_c0_g1_i2.p1 TRINITY_DN125_c0_g1~~TRINITY_DN125_c0_g1_i2.p1  ORF type:complete len:308 (+),score=102.14 TRINITY_DN125_c0_g1_i2:134-1057(+)